MRPPANSMGIYTAEIQGSMNAPSLTHGRERHSIAVARMGRRQGDQSDCAFPMSTDIRLPASGYEGSTLSGTGPTFSHDDAPTLASPGARLKHAPPYQFTCVRHPSTRVHDWLEPMCSPQWRPPENRMSEPPTSLTNPASVDRAPETTNVTRNQGTSHKITSTLLHQPPNRAMKSTRDTRYPPYCVKAARPASSAPANPNYAFGVCSRSMSIATHLSAIT